MGIIESLEGRPLSAPAVVPAKDFTDAAPAAPAMTDDEVDAGLPVMTGYNVLLALPKVEATFGNGLIKADATIETERITTIIGLVLDIGPDAYKDKDRFPSGPYCKVGDYVLIGAYKGTRFAFNGNEYRVLNDDSVLGVVADPRGYKRVA